MRAEELIMRAWTQRKELLLEGRKPAGVCLSKESYDLIQRYHSRLGFLPEGVADYITRYSLFDLPFYLDDSEECRVVAEGGAEQGS